MEIVQKILNKYNNIINFVVLRHLSHVILTFVHH